MPPHRQFGPVDNVRGRIPAAHNRGMTVLLRLDPRFPPVWRDAHTLQFGVPSPVAPLTPLPWQEHLVHELGRGISETGLPVWAESRGIRRRYLDDILDLLAPVLVRVRLEEYVPAPPVVAVDDADVPTTLSRILAAGLDAAGWRVVTLAHPAASSAALVIVVGAHVVHPRRTQTHLLDDRPYLPVTACGAGVVIGPLVVPGTTACTTCHDLHRRDADALWPQLAAQLLHAPPPEPSIAHALEASAAVARAIGATGAWSLGVPAAQAGRIWTLAPRARGASRITIDEVTPHPECGCGAVAASVRAPRRRARASAATAAASVPLSQTG